jgi:hypothetical protein
MQYLVVVQYAVDDIPILLTSDRDEAIKVATNAGEHAGDIVLNMFNAPHMPPCRVFIYTFRNGQMVGYEAIKDF